MLYNAILRRTPDNLFEPLEKGGNLFPTTIHVLQSAIVKIAAKTKIPENLVLYRGLSARFPAEFYKADENGRRGFAEWGFMSTTANRDIAVMYSGAKKGMPMATVLQIRTSAVNRPACIEMFSQYAHEREYLWVPLSYMQPEGTQMREVTKHGIVVAVDVAVSANGLAATTDDLVGKKKQTHIRAFESIVDELRVTLTREAGDRRSNADGARDMVDSILREVEERLAQHKEADPLLYLDAIKFREMNHEMLEVRRFALSKVRFWGQSGLVHTHLLPLPLRTCHRLLIGLKRKRLEEAGEAAHGTDYRELCKLKGLPMIGSLNELGESVLMQAAADDMSPSTLRLLIRAGSFINRATPEGFTALIRAAQFGNVDCLRTLLDARADIDAPHLATRKTALHLAAQNGHADCVEALLGAGAAVDAPSRDGSTPLVIAAEFGSLACVRALLRAGAEVNRRTEDGTTAVALAAKGGHAECVRALRAAGAVVGAAGGGEQVAMDGAAEGGAAGATRTELDD